MSLERRPHLLYVAWGYPPSRSGGAYRLLATANAFARSGWDVTVLTCEREVFLRSTGIDPSMEERIDPSIDVHRLPFPNRETILDLTQWSRFRAWAPEIWNMLQAMQTARTFPEPRYGLWRPVLENAAEQVHQKHPVDLVIGSANPNVVHVAGAYLHQQHGVPFVMDYRDTWQLDMYSGKRTLSDRHPAATWERKLVGDAAEIWFVNDPIAQWHAELYPDAAERIRVVPNGFDPGFVGAAAVSKHSAPTTVHVGNIGTMTGQTPIRPLIEGWTLARQSGDALADAQLDLYGYLGHQGDDEGGVLTAISEVGDCSVAYRGPVAKAEISAIYNGLDVLILPLGTSRFMTSGKVFEYMATGLPIVSVHDPVNASSGVLSGYPGWFPVELMDAASIADALGKAVTYARGQTDADRVAAREWASAFERSNILEPIIERWTERIEKGS
ncbi:glycosyltransferase [Paramicrobacterium fandaimingii]|uniref:glycosyltransferase n=1 Tax=Paramicrobacterium fandaimingii TaxID=2708079 RepID=UPI0014239108|nr:glycosyltransferase [Microbacterium fandaimingii]